MTSRAVKHNQSQSAYQQLRRLLIHDQIRPATRLTEIEWARRLGVNRSALREALGMLAHEGLLRRGERGGYFVPALEYHDLTEVWEVRAILEAGAIRTLCLRGISDDEHAQLSDCCDQMQRMLDSGLELGFVEADRLFHLSLIRFTRNSRLIDIYERAPLPLQPSTEMDPDTRYRVLARTVEEHRKLAQLIHTQQTADALELLDHHLHRAHQLTPLY